MPVALRTTRQQGVEGERTGERRNSLVALRRWSRSHSGRHPGGSGPIWHRRPRLHHGRIHDGRTLRTTSLGCGPFLFSSLECFVNSAHDFLSLERSCSDWRRRSANVARVRSASTRSNCPAPGVVGGGPRPAGGAPPPQKTQTHAPPPQLSRGGGVFSPPNPPPKNTLH